MDLLKTRKQWAIASLLLLVAGMLLVVVAQRAGAPSSLIFYLPIGLTSFLVLAAFVAASRAAGRSLTAGVVAYVLVGLVFVLVRWGFPNIGYTVNILLWPGFWGWYDACLLGLSPCPN